MARDYAAITEVPGSQLNAEQMARFVHRYAVCALFGSGRTLEVACGPAIGLGALQAHGFAVAGLCYTPEVLQGAQAHYGGRLPLLGGDAQQLPLAASSFDTILCLEAIYYFDAPLAFLAEVRRVLAPGGLLLIGWSNPDWPHFVPGALSGHYPSAPELGGWLQDAGFRSVQLYGAFPVHAAGSRHASALRVRRLLLRSGVANLIQPASGHLKRLAYGRLYPLPAELSPMTLQAAAADLRLQLLPLGELDKVHRVLYVIARS